MTTVGTRKRPRLLHVTTTDMSLGWLLEPQLHAFADAGFEVVTASAPGPMVTRLLDAGIGHEPIHSFARSIDPTADIRAGKELRSVLGTLSPDIVHTHNPKPGVMGRILARRRSGPAVVNTVHGLYAQPTDSIKRRLAVYGIERAAAAFSDAELVQSIEDVDTLVRLGVPSERVHLLGNGIDLNRFRRTPTVRAQSAVLRRQLGIGPNVPIVGAVGRLVWEKGYRDLFAAVEQLRASNRSPFEVVIVGPEETGKSDAIGQRDIDEMSRLGVHFLGARDDIDVLLEMFDIFVLASRREGFPRAAMEACAMGVPVVTTNIRGCRQVVRDGHNGLLYEPGDSRQLAGAIHTLIDEEITRRRLGVNGISRAQVEFDQERVISRTLSVYRSLLGKRSERYDSSINAVDRAASKSGPVSAAPAASLERSA